jgi:hypothetical protein
MDQIMKFKSALSEIEYMNWLGKRIQRKFGKITYTLFTNGTATEVSDVAKKLKGYLQASSVETFKAKNGETRKVHLLYVTRDEKGHDLFMKRLSERLT